MSSPAAVSKKIEQIELQLGKLKLMLTAKSAVKSKSVSKPKNKPESIEKCKKKTDLEKFTVAELKKWAKNNNVDLKKLSNKHKKDYVKLVWKSLGKLKESENISSEESSSSESPSSSEISSSSDSDA